MSITVHIPPMDDPIEHETSDGCGCGPTTNPDESEEGSVGWVVVHHSPDGRGHRQRRRECDHHWE